MTGGPSRVFQQTTQVMEKAANALASRAAPAAIFGRTSIPWTCSRHLWPVDRRQRRRLARKVSGHSSTLLQGSRPDSRPSSPLAGR